VSPAELKAVVESAVQSAVGRLVKEWQIGDRVLSLEEAAKVLGVEPATVIGMQRKGLRWARVGESGRYTRMSDLIAYIDAQANAPKGGGQNKGKGKGGKRQGKLGTDELAPNNDVPAAEV
jgi:hypothetical protein